MSRATGDGSRGARRASAPDPVGLRAASALGWPAQLLELGDPAISQRVIHLIPGFHGGTDTSLVVAAVQSPLSADAHSANARGPRSNRDVRAMSARNMPKMGLRATPYYLAILGGTER